MCSEKVDILIVLISCDLAVSQIEKMDRVLNELKQHSLVITVTSHEHHGISNHWQLDCQLISCLLFRLTTNKTSALCIIGERNPQ